MGHLILLPSSPPRLNLPPPLLDLSLKLSDLFKTLHFFLLILLGLLDLLALHLALELIGPALGNVARAEVGEEVLEELLDDEAGDVVDDHDGRHLVLELVGEGDELHLGVDVRDELHGAGKGEARDADDAVEHALVLREGFAEGAALVVDGEGGDLLDELEEVDGGVEEGGGELGLEIDVVAAAAGVLVTEMCGEWGWG